MTQDSARKKGLCEKFAEGIDDFVGVFSPMAAAKRKYFRFVAREMLGSYRGADIGRLRGSWIPRGGSADYDLLHDLPKLRERSRDLVRNDGIAAGAIDTLVTNIIGSGIRPQSRIDQDILKVDADYADQLKKKVERVWERWVEYADAGNRMNFYQLEELSERQRFVNGEAIIIPVRVIDSKRKRPYTLALQMVESDRLDTPVDLIGDKSIRRGVQVGQYGEPINYYIRKTHPGDYIYSRNSSNTSANYIVYPAINSNGDFNIFHLYHVLRSGQSRGEPFFAPVINLFKDRADYMEAELLANKIAACFAIFIKTDNANNLSLARSRPDKQGKRIEEIYPAMVEYLNENESIESFNPNRPGGTFGLFMERILRDISAGMNLPYEVLAKDFSKSNYSNTRAALLEARRFFMMQQEFVAKQLCQPILVMLMEEAYLNGELDILDFYQNRDAYVRTKWVSPGWQWVDPLKEAQASILAVDNNISNLSEEYSNQGKDWEDELEQIAREKKRIKELEDKYGVAINPDPLVKTGIVRDSGGKSGNQDENQQQA